MNHRKYFTLFVLPVICIGFLSGCASTTKPYIPDQVPQLTNDMARIVFTRESQLAGARWDLDLVDIGDNIEPNAMISYRYCHSKKSIPPQDILRSDLTGDIMNDFYWRNPDRIKFVYCGDGSSHCNNEYYLGFYRGDTGLLWETGAALGMSGRTAVEMVQDRQSVSEQLDLVNRLIKLISGDDSQMTLPPDSIVNLFFKYFKRENIVPLMENLRTNTLDHSTVICKSTFLDDYELKSTIDLGVLGLYQCEKDGLQAFKSIEADTNIVFTSTIRHEQGPCMVKDYLIDNRSISRNIQTMGKLGSGETLIWDRKPGAMRLAMIWYDGSDIMSEDVMVEAGKTYYLHYTVRQPKAARWELIDVK